MLGTLVQMQTGQSISADGVLGKHALDGQLHRELRALSHELVVLDFLQVADPAGVMVVGLLIELVAGQNSLVHVDDHDEVTAINVGREVDFMLAAQQSGGGHSGAAQGLAGCVENVPFSLDILLFHHSGHVVSSILFGSAPYNSSTLIAKNKHRTGIARNRSVLILS